MLAIRGLVFRYPQGQGAALDGVSFDLRRGEVLGLLGPNGAGKTTLIAHLSGALTVQEGEITVDGQPLAHVRRTTPTRIAIAPQEYAFYPMLTAQENLECFAAAAGLTGVCRRQRIATCLAFVQLERHAGVRASRLSGGLKRRLNLAIALLAEPELLLLDEPTAGVDPQSRAFLLDAVRTLAQAGTSVLYTSHYMEEIEAIASRAVIIDSGRVLCAGTLDELLREASPQVQLAVGGLAPDSVHALLQRFGVATADGSAGWHVTLEAGQTAPRLLAAVEAAGGHVAHARFGRRDLEQVFMALTRRSLRD
jgi:ABC-2 type transport system ATP-binding protein